MDHTLKIEVKDQAISSEKVEQKRGSGTEQRTYYLCFCSKKYRSYSALYLHVKKVHNRCLTMKCLKVRTHQWSGSVKNIYHQFHEDDSLSEQKSQQSHHAKSKVKAVQNNQKKVVETKEKQLDGGVVKKETSCKIQKGHNFPFKNCIFNIFKLYKEQQLSNSQNHSFHPIIDQFITFINENYKKFDEDAVCQDYCNEKTCENIPYAFNYFYINLCPGPVLDNYLIDNLGKLANWLYQQKYCKLLAIDGRKWQQQPFAFK